MGKKGKSIDAEMLKKAKRLAELYDIPDDKMTSEEIFEFYDLAMEADPETMKRYMREAIDEAALEMGMTNREFLNSMREKYDRHIKIN